MDRIVQNSKVYVSGLKCLNVAEPVLLTEMGWDMT
jgi:hypothetical protein